jgi:hypothetical protein
MSERFPSSPSSEPEPEPSKEAPNKWFPTDEELAAFEAERALYHDPKFVPTFEGYFGRPDPRIMVYERPADLPEGAWYPTEQELATFENERSIWLNSDTPDFVPTFESYFGRPDPRIKRMVRPGEPAERQQSEADDDAGPPISQQANQCSAMRSVLLAGLLKQLDQQAADLRKCLLNCSISADHIASPVDSGLTRSCPHFRATENLSLSSLRTP